MKLFTVERLADIPPAHWNRLAGTANPFVRHEFLAALEDSGCVGGDTGWSPTHLLARDAQGRLLGAMPLYWKFHSFGEFVFDWAWADAYQRAGMRYYPKLLGAVPFTPVPGPRVLFDESGHTEIVPALLRGAVELARRRGASSVHWLFPRSDDVHDFRLDDLQARVGYQFHWRNPGYRDFDDFLGTLTSKRRKAIKRERREVARAGVEIEILDGHGASESDWWHFHRFYAAIFDRKWGFPSLTLDFFLDIAERMADDIVLVMARRGGRCIAGAFNLAGDNALFGRHWGCSEYVPGLHFEACYYQAIDHCIRNRLARFEAGAQGEHKLARGFLPTLTHSAHWIAHAGFRSALGRFLTAEQRHVRQEISMLNEHSPFKAQITAAQV